MNDVETEGTYKWDGSQNSVAYTNWATYEPNNGADTGEEDCVEFSSSATWNDYYCSGFKGYFCERPVTSKYFITEYLLRSCNYCKYCKQ